MKNLSKINGFSLIEVMISLVILAVGILGISKLQGTLIQTSSDANQRTVAASLAQQKLDDLKSFAKLTVGTSSDSVPDNWATVSGAIAATNLAFDHITDNQGGALCASGLDAADALVVATHCPNAANLVSVGNYNYQLDWDVTNYNYVAGVATATVATTDIDFKRVTVNVAWTDESGNDQAISLDTVIDSYAPALSALANNSSTGGNPPQANYTPEAAPDVIDIDVDIGDGLKRQTSKPLPDAVQTGSDSNTLVTFEVMTYHVNPADSAEFFADRQEEFQTVDCTCELSSTSATTFPPGHVVWDEDENDRYDAVGAPISKVTATQTGNANAVDEVCTVCCRDHHDDTASPVKYVAGTTTGNHAHYKADGTVAAAGDEYIESCRFKRIDGVMRVFQDWQLLDLTVMNRDNLVDGDALQTQYTAYVQQLIKDEIDTTTLATQPPLRTPINTAVGTIQQLEARGIYLDDVYDTSGNLSTAYATYVADNTNLDRLERVPFAEVNLSLLAQWSAGTSATVSVRNDDVATISDPLNDYYGTYSRGLITAHAAVATPGVDITASMDPNNDGITQLAINPSPGTPVTDTVKVIVDATATNITVTGDMSVSSSDSSNINGVKITMNAPECSFDAGSDGPFTCSFLSGSNVSISISAEKNNSCTGTGTFSQLNVTTDIATGVIAIDCTAPGP